MLQILTYAICGLFPKRRKVTGIREITTRNTLQGTLQLVVLVGVQECAELEYAPPGCELRASGSGFRF